MALGGWFMDKTFMEMVTLYAQSVCRGLEKQDHALVCLLYFLARE